MKNLVHGIISTTLSLLIIDVAAKDRTCFKRHPDINCNIDEVNTTIDCSSISFDEDNCVFRGCLNCLNSKFETTPGFENCTYSFGSELICNYNKIETSAIIIYLLFSLFTASLIFLIISHIFFQCKRKCEAKSGDCEPIVAKDCEIAEAVEQKIGRTNDMMVILGDDGQFSEE